MPMPNKLAEIVSVLGLVVLGAEVCGGLVDQGCVLTTSGWTS